MANNASATVDLKILISVIQNQSQSLATFQNQIQSLLKQLQTSMPAGVIPGLAANVGALNNQLNGIQAATNAGVAGLNTLNRAVSSLTNGLRFLAGGFLALESVRFLKGIADVSARAETLQTVLHVVAQNSGVAAEEIDKIDKKVQRLGITATASRQALTQMLSAGLNTAYAEALARAAQDLAVISGMDSSQTFQRMIVNIQQMDALGLRWMGIIVDRTKAEKDYRNLHKEITGELTKRQATEAFMLEVLEKAKSMQGAYTNAMGDVGKQLTSLTRYTENYKKALGDSLLPAYSAIVREITSLLEKLTLQATVFSANRERSLSWAESIGTVVKAISDMILFVHKHIDQIVELVKWYAVLRGAMLVWTLLTTAAARIAALLDFLAKLKLAMSAWLAGTVSMTTAIQAMNAANTIAAAKLLQVAAAETLVGDAALVAAAGVRTLMLAWGILASLLAVPIIGYAIVKINEEQEAEDAMSWADKAAKAREDMIAGRSNRRDVKYGQGPYNTLDLGYYAYFQEFTVKYPQLVAGLKTVKEQMEAFDKFLLARPEAISRYAAEIDAAANELRAAQLSLAEAKDPAEYLFAEDRVKKAAERDTQVRKDMKAAFEAQASPTTLALSKQMDIVHALEAQVVATDKDKSKKQDVLDKLRAQLVVEKELLAIQQTKFEEALKVDEKADPSRAQRQRDLIRVGNYFREIGESTAAEQAAFATLFGKARFEREGMTSAAFNEQLGAFDEIVKAAEKQKAKLGAVMPELAEQVRRGLTKVGQAAQTDVDLDKARKRIADVEALGIAGTKAKGAQALELARLGTRDATLAVGAPILSERLDRIAKEADARIEAERLDETRMKTRTEFENLALEQRYKQHLVLLDTYYNERVARMYALGQKELRIQEEVIRKADESRDAAFRAGDVKKGQTFAQSAVDARNKLVQIEGKNELEIAKLRADQETKRTELTKGVTTALLAQRAAAGGLTAQLENINRQLELEREKYAELPSAQADQLVFLKRLQLEADAYRKAREETLNIEKGMTQALQDQINFEQARRDAAEARDRRLQAQGQLTTREFTQRQTERIEEARFDNRASRTRALQVLEDTRERQANDRLREQGSLQELVIAGALSEAEAKRRLTALDQQQQAEILAQKTAIEGLDKAYEDLGASVEKYSQAIQAHFIEGFADALTQSIVDFKKAGEAWVNLSKSIANDIVSVFMKAFTERLFKHIGLFGWVDKTMDMIFGGGGGYKPGEQMRIPGLAGGGMVEGPGTGTSDSVPALLSAGEHVMPAAKAAVWMPVLEAIRTGRLGMSMGGPVQSIALGSVIPRRYAGGGVVMTDGGAAAVQTGAMGGNMMVQLHPEALNMTMRDWLEHEVVRQHSRR